MTQTKASINMQITDTAREQLLSMKEEGLTPRITLVKSGCCGYTLQLYGDKIHGDDTVYTCDGIEMIIEEKALPLLGYSEIDYRRNGFFKDFKVGPRYR